MKLNSCASLQVNDAHDTTIDFAASFLQYWFIPLLTDPRVNGEDTLILLTFDENETGAIQNRVFTLALGPCPFPFIELIAFPTSNFIAHTVYDIRHGGPAQLTGHH